jgi:hypothetical protein
VSMGRIPLALMRRMREMARFGQIKG